MGECRICMDGFKQPRMLPCGHSFCTNCVQTLLDNHTSKCPLCMQQFKAKSAQNFPLNYCLANFLETSSTSSADLCCQHRKPLELFCTNCSREICTACATSHKGHSVQQSIVLRNNALQKLTCGKERSEQLLHIVRNGMLDPKTSLSKAIVQVNNDLQTELTKYDVIIEIAQSAKNKLEQSAASTINEMVQQAGAQYSGLLDRTNALVNLVTVGNNGSIVKLNERVMEMERGIAEVTGELGRLESMQPADWSAEQDSLLQTLEELSNKLEQSLQQRKLGRTMEEQSVQAVEQCNERNGGKLSQKILLKIGGWPLCSSPEILAYCPESDKWNKEAELNKRHDYGAAVNWNNKVIVAGGVRAMNSVEQYDPVTKQRLDLSSLVVGRCYHAMVTLDGCLFVIGGWNGKMALKSVEKFAQTTSLKWTLTSELATARRGLTACAMQGCIVAVGGSNLTEVFNSCEIYQPQKQQWKTISSMNKRRYLAASAVHNNTMFVFGGATNSQQVHQDAEQFTKESGQWTLLRSTMSASRFALAACKVGRFVFLLGGASTGLISSPLLESFDPQTGQFCCKQSLPKAIDGLSAVCVQFTPTTTTTATAATADSAKSQKTSD